MRIWFEIEDFTFASTTVHLPLTSCQVMVKSSWTFPVKSITHLHVFLESVFFLFVLLHFCLPLVLSSSSLSSSTFVFLVIFLHFCILVCLLPLCPFTLLQFVFLSFLSSSRLSSSSLSSYALLSFGMLPIPFPFSSLSSFHIIFQFVFFPLYFPPVCLLSLKYFFSISSFK